MTECSDASTRKYTEHSAASLTPEHFIDTAPPVRLGGSGAKRKRRDGQAKSANSELSWKKLRNSES